MRRTLNHVKITPPWFENDLKNIFEKVTSITNIKLPKVKLCPGNMKNNFSQAHNVKLPILPQGDINQLYLEALHTKTWQLGNTTLPFYCCTMTISKYISVHVDYNSVFVNTVRQAFGERIKLC